MSEGIKRRQQASEGMAEPTKRGGTGDSYINVECTIAAEQQGHARRIRLKAYAYSNAPCTPHELGSARKQQYRFMHVGR